MNTKLLAAGFVAALATLIFTGCSKVDPPSITSESSSHLPTVFQSESQYIVQTVITDLVRQIYYAASNRLVDSREFVVIATEKSDGALNAPVYQVEISLDSRLPKLELNLPLNGPIWSPRIYRELGSALVQVTGLRTGITNPPADLSMLTRLRDGTAETIERENQALSTMLEKEFLNPELHERAALLLGAFLLRDHSGHFYDLRSPLCRLTVHLCMADCIRGSASRGINGQLAEAILLTFMGNEVRALDQMKTVDLDDASVASLVRTLRMRNTGDYRLVAGGAESSPVEQASGFAAMADYASAPVAWQRLSEEQKVGIDYIRIANSMDYSVEIGHTLLQVALPLELEEIQRLYRLSQNRDLRPQQLVAALNEMPQHPWYRGPGQQPQFRIIGWDQWALFFQRHLCHAMQQNFHFMQYKWGVPDQAKVFAAQCERNFSGLRLYPFVRRLNCTTAKDYHQAVDEGAKVTLTTPHLVPVQCWNYLLYPVSFAPLYRTSMKLQLSEWCHRNPLPGTVYDLGPRLNHSTWGDRSNAVARFEQLHELAPCDVRIVDYLLANKYTNRPTYELALNLFSSVLPYSIYASRVVAATVEDQPHRFTELMLQAAKLNPVCYYDLGQYALHRDQEDEAARYAELACNNDPDQVRAASFAEWRIRY